MATIVFADGVDEIIGSRKGLTFDRSQAGNYVKKKPAPINHQTTDRMKLRTLLKETNAYFWNMPFAQRRDWEWVAGWNGITGPYGTPGQQAGCALFFKLLLNARLAGDPFYVFPPSPITITGVNFTALTRINKDTIRATFNPSPAGANDRIYLRQGLPGPGIRRWEKIDGYITERSNLNPTSPYDFTTHFQHLIGWNCRYWTGTQENTGRRSTEDLWDL